MAAKRLALCVGLALATRAAAEELGLVVKIFEARSPDGLEPAFDAMASAGLQAVTVNPEGLPFQARALIARLALARRLALCTYSRETFEPGALMSYGIDNIDVVQKAAIICRSHPTGRKTCRIAGAGAD